MFLRVLGEKRMSDIKEGDITKVRGVPRESFSKFSKYGV